MEVDNILFVCRCLYEYQSPEACLLFLAKVQYELDLEDQTLDPHHCCVLSYVVSQTTHRNIDLNLTDCNISDPGVKLLLGSLKNLTFLRYKKLIYGWCNKLYSNNKNYIIYKVLFVYFAFYTLFFIPRSTSRLQSQMWRAAFEAEQFSDFDSLLSLFSFEMHLYAHETQDQKVFQRIGEVLKKKRSESVHLFLHVNEKLITRSLQKAIFESVSNIATIRYNTYSYNT